MSSHLGGGGDTPKDDTLMTDDRWQGGGGVLPWGTGEGLILLESIAIKQKDLVSGRGVHKN